MFQALQLTELALVHGAKVLTVLEIISYLSISFIPTILPMSLLLAVLLTYSRMSNNSEVIAFKALGLSSYQLASPAIILSLLAFFLSAYTAFNIAPWGNRQFEVLIEKVSNSKVTISIREGTFSEGFFDLVVYANKVNSKENQLREVFIYDERENTPITIVAQEGLIIKKPENSQSILLRLKNGDIHRQKTNHTKIHFDTYDIQLSKPEKTFYKKKTPSSLTYQDLKDGLQSSQIHLKKKIIFEIEIYKRWALSFACIIFALLGVGLGMKNNRRTGKSEGMTIATGIIITYWILYILFENMGRNGLLPIPIALWLPNLFFGIYAIRSIKE